MNSTGGSSHLPGHPAGSVVSSWLRVKRPDLDPVVCCLLRHDGPKQMDQSRRKFNLRSHQCCVVVFFMVVVVVGVVVAVALAMAVAAPVGAVGAAALVLALAAAAAAAALALALPMVLLLVKSSLLWAL